MKYLKKTGIKISLFIAVCLSAVMGGCATNYSCGQFPDSQCSPVSATYDSTNEGYYDYRKGLFEQDEKEKQRKRDLKSEYANLSENIKRLSVSESGDPILSKPLYMRWLFNDWVDRDNNLHSGGYFYVKLKESKWITAQ